MLFVWVVLPSLRSCFSQQNQINCPGSSKLVYDIYCIGLCTLNDDDIYFHMNDNCWFQL